MATFADLEATNPHLRKLFREWLDLREETGEDITDYQAFRQHVIFRGAPDPGEAPLDDFLTPDGVPNERTWGHARGQVHGMIRPEEADASSLARPISDAEAAQLGPLRTLDAPPASSSPTGRTIHDTRGDNETETASGTGARPTSASLPTSPETITSVNPPHEAQGDRTTNTIVSNGRAAAPLTYAYSAPEAPPSASGPVRAPSDDADRSPAAVFRGRAPLIAVLLLLLGGTAGAWWLIRRRRRPERSRITTGARHVTRAAAARTSKAVAAVADVAVVAARRSRRIGTALTAEGERLLERK
jgi:hypothetical protein